MRANRLTAIRADRPAKSFRTNETPCPTTKKYVVNKREKNVSITATLFFPFGKKAGKKSKKKRPTALGEKEYILQSLPHSLRGLYFMGYLLVEHLVSISDSATGTLKGTEHFGAAEKRPY